MNGISNSKSLKRICGIDKNFIHNLKKYELLLDEMLCPICLNVLLDPIECMLYRAIICQNNILY